MNEKENMEDMEQESGEIKGGIKINEIINKRRMILAVATVAVILVSIVGVNAAKKSKKEGDKTITLGDEGGIKVGVGGSEDDGLTDEEKRELERLAGEEEERRRQAEAAASGNEVSQNTNFTAPVNTNYSDDNMFANTGGFTNIPNTGSDNTEGNIFSGENENNKNKKRTLSALGETAPAAARSEQEIAAGLLQNQDLNQATVPNNQAPDPDQNRQEDKRNFVADRRTEGYYSQNTRMPAIGRYEIKTGDLIPASLATAINSDLPGEIVAQVTRDVKDFKTMKHVLIPMGTRVIGKYDSSITYGQDRVLVVWQRLVFPDGSYLLLDNFQGVDLLGNSGLKGKTNNHFWKLLRSVVMSAGINMATGTLESVNVNIDGSSRSRVSVGAGASDAANNVKSIGERLVEKDLNRQPTIMIKQGSRFNIFVNKDIILPPYKGR